MGQFVKENRKLYYALLFLALFPTIYQTFRVYLTGQLPDPYSFSIAGQLSWVNLHIRMCLTVYFMGLGKRNTYWWNLLL